MSTFSQGICGDGAAILKNGAIMTVDEIVAEFERLQAENRELVQKERQRAAGIVLKRAFPSVSRGDGLLEEIVKEILGE